MLRSMALHWPMPQLMAPHLPMALQLQMPPLWELRLQMPQSSVLHSAMFSRLRHPLSSLFRVQDASHLESHSQSVDRKHPFR